MTLENAVKHIMKDTFSWMEMMSDNKTKMLINFPSLFLHNCTLLKQTEEFKAWSNLSFLKAKNLHFNYDDEVNFTIEFWYPENKDSIKKLNNLIKKEIDSYIFNIEYPGYAERWEYKINVNDYKNTNIIVKEEKELLNLQTIENFNF